MQRSGKSAALLTIHRNYTGRTKWNQRDKNDGDSGLDGEHRQHISILIQRSRYRAVTMNGLYRRFPNFRL